MLNDEKECKVVLCVKTFEILSSKVCHRHGKRCLASYKGGKYWVSTARDDAKLIGSIVRKQCI